jgi:predicted RNA-binding Zn-ribbon protein involved in translation (DUF1610 family)
MTLDEWNEKRKQYWADVRRKVTHPQEFSNGLDCPQCGSQKLYDTGRVLSTSPNILQIKCQCGFKGSRYE